MPFDNVISDVSYYGGFAWMYGIKKDLWDAATRSYVKNIHQLEKPNLITLVEPSWCVLGTGSGRRNATNAGKNNRQSCVGGFVTGGTWNSYLGQKPKTCPKMHCAMSLRGIDPTNDNAWRRYEGS